MQCNTSEQKCISRVTYCQEVHVKLTSCLTACCTLQSLLLLGDLKGKVICRKAGHMTLSLDHVIRAHFAMCSMQSSRT